MIAPASDRNGRTKARQPNEPQPEPAVKVPVSVFARLSVLVADINMILTHSAVSPMLDGHVETSSTFSTPSPALEPARNQAPPPPTPQPVAAAQSLSLLGYYNSEMLAKKKKTAAQKTWKDHQTSAGLFDQFWQASGNHRFYTPEVQAIQNEPTLLEEFASWLFTTRQNSAVIVGRRMTHVSMIIKAMLKDGTVSRFRSDPVPMKQLKKLRRTLLEEDIDANERRIPSFQEIEAIASAVDSRLVHPYQSHAGYFWLGWIRFCALFGPRGRDIVSIDPQRPEKRGLRKQDVYFDTLCPMADVNNARGEELHSEFGWLWYHIGKDHSSDTPKILLPMPEFVRDWIQYFMALSADGEDRVFPGSKGVNSFLTQGPISERWKTILRRANVDPMIQLSEGKGKKIAIRKAASNWWKLKTQQERKDERLAEVMAAYLLHHASTTVTDVHYLNVQSTVLPVMLELLPQFPIPAKDADLSVLLPQ